MTGIGILLIMLSVFLLVFLGPRIASIILATLVCWSFIVLFPWTNQVLPIFIGLVWLILTGHLFTQKKDKGPLIY